MATREEKSTRIAPIFADLRHDDEVRSRASGVACADIATANAKITATNLIILSPVANLCEAPALVTGASRELALIG
jgi:hypothetical protein